MDISQFSKCLKDMVRTHDEIVVPGLGSFTAQNIPASVEEDGTPVPPYRKIAYIPAEKEDDGTFLRFLAKYLPEGSDAEGELRDFIQDFCGEMEQKHTVTLEGLGEMKATGHKIYYFVPDTSFFQYPDVPGQESVGTLLPEDYADEESRPIELSAEKWAKADEEEDAAAQEKKAPEEPVKKAPKPADPEKPEEPEQPEEPEEEPEPESPQARLFGNILLILFVVLIFLMIAVTLFKDMPWMSNLLDHLLYTKEELEILGK
jgi:hypothetical protein